MYRNRKRMKTTNIEAGCQILIKFFKSQRYCEIPVRDKSDTYSLANIKKIKRYIEMYITEN